MGNRVATRFLRPMTSIQLLPNLHLLTPGGWQAYLWRTRTGHPHRPGAAGSGTELSAALAELGLKPGDVDRLVLTHFHDDVESVH